MQNVKENGGIMRDEDITDTVFEMPELIEVRLQDARNQLKNNTFISFSLTGCRCGN